MVHQTQQQLTRPMNNNTNNKNNTYVSTWHKFMFLHKWHKFMFEKWVDNVVGVSYPQQHPTTTLESGHLVIGRPSPPTTITMLLLEGTSNDKMTDDASNNNLLLLLAPICNQTKQICNNTWNSLLLKFDLVAWIIRCCWLLLLWPTKNWLVSQTKICFRERKNSHRLGSTGYNLILLTIQ